MPTNPSPARLAHWAAKEAKVGDPAFLVHDVASHFDIRIVTDRTLRKAGELKLDRNDIVIVVRAGTLARRRFTAAHELGHYLLACEANVSLRDQINDPRTESYCNSFASHLLLPRKWVHDVVASHPPSLRTAITLSHWSQTSLLAAVVALNDSCHWNSLLVRWAKARDESGWVARTVISSCPADLVEPVGDLDDLLRDLNDHPRRVHVDVRLNGTEVGLSGEAVRLGASFFTLTPRVT
jgi:hypothetical protein